MIICLPVCGCVGIFSGVFVCLSVGLHFFFNVLFVGLLVCCFVVLCLGIFYFVFLLVCIFVYCLVGGFFSFARFLVCWFVSLFLVCFYMLLLTYLLVCLLVDILVCFPSGWFFVC